jgi:Dyp-type peroxidase family
LLQTEARVTPQLELNDIQGNTIFGYRFPHTRFLLVRFDEVEGGRAFLRAIEGMVMPSTRWAKDASGRSIKPESTLNVAFTHGGLKALGVPLRTLASFPPEFRQGMLARAELNHDTGSSSPSRWDEVWRSGEVHALLSLYAKDLPTLDVLTGRVSQAMGGATGVVEVARQEAGKLVIDGRVSDCEHFGYRDGISNPDVTGTGVPSPPGDGKPIDSERWETIEAGEFLLGQPDEAGETPVAPVPVQLARNGTYLVYRKLHQNVASFRRYLREEGSRFPGGPDLLAAKFLGRWQDGTPLERSPYRKDPIPPASGGGKDNGFFYAGDPNGARCPLSAHIRRGNPRDGDGFGGVITNRHRMIRRGVPYGPWIPEGEGGDDSGEHGIIFIAINASIERQFEFVQQQWMNYGNDFLQGNDRDLIIGNHRPHDKMVIQGDPDRSDRSGRPYLCTGLPQFVETRGGDYFFVPGLNALREIARGTVESH